MPFEPAISTVPGPMGTGRAAALRQRGISLAEQCDEGARGRHCVSEVSDRALITSTEDMAVEAA